MAITGNIKADWDHFSNKWNNFWSNAQDVWDSLLFGKTNTINKQVSDQNLDFQREQLDYEKGLQQQIFDREDTSYQRTAQDMRAAGLNPLSMQGTNGSGEAIALSGMHNDYQQTSQGILQALNTVFNNALNFKATQSNYSLNQAQANLLNAQAENQKIKNLYEADNLDLDYVFKRLQNDSALWNNYQTRDNYLFNITRGWTENMPDWLKMNSAKFNYKPLDRIFNLNKYQEMLNKNGYGLQIPNIIGEYNKVGDEYLAQKIVDDQLLQGLLGLVGKLF